MQGFFITGTDTGVGKTTITAALLNALHKKGLSTIALKPVATGCIDSAYELRNQDAIILQQEASIKLDYALINPYLFPQATSPNIAAENVGITMTAKTVYQACQTALSVPADYVLIEGAGGWYCPLNHSETFVDLVRLFALPVILVVGVRLGCLNHALLTCQAIQAAGCNLVGWVANIIEPNMLCRDEYLASLKNFIPAQCLGTVPYEENHSYATIADHIDLCFSL